MLGSRSPRHWPQDSDNAARPIRVVHNVSARAPIVGTPLAVRCASLESTVVGGGCAAAFQIGLRLRSQRHRSPPPPRRRPAPDDVAILSESQPRFASFEAKRASGGPFPEGTRQPTPRSSPRRASRARMLDVAYLRRRAGGSTGANCAVAVPVADSDRRRALLTT